MNDYIYVAQTNCVPGKEAALRDWYGEHIERILSIDSFCRASQYQLASVQREGSSFAYKQFTFYEIEGEPEAALSGLDHLQVSGAISKSPLITSHAACLLEKIVPSSE